MSLIHLHHNSTVRVMHSWVSGQCSYTIPGFANINGSSTTELCQLDLEIIVTECYAFLWDVFMRKSFFVLQINLTDVLAFPSSLHSLYTLSLPHHIWNHTIMGAVLMVLIQNLPLTQVPQRQAPSTLQTMVEVCRRLHLTQVTLCTHHLLQCHEQTKKPYFCTFNMLISEFPGFCTFWHKTVSLIYTSVKHPTTCIWDILFQ